MENTVDNLLWEIVGGGVGGDGRLLPALPTFY